MKYFFIILILTIYNQNVSSKMIWPLFQSCSGDDVNSCSGIILQSEYEFITNLNCSNCTRFFLCMANFHAVHRCEGNKNDNRQITLKISSCREEAENVDPNETADNQLASMFGRYGGNCASRYLCNVNCNYDPKTQTCQESKCSN
jgi:hypothetical protein